MISNHGPILGYSQIGVHYNFKKQIFKKHAKQKLSLQLFVMANFDRVNGPIDM
jgi:hypothetical protein